MDNERRLTMEADLVVLKQFTADLARAFGALEVPCYDDRMPRRITSQRVAAGFDTKLAEGPVRLRRRTHHAVARRLTRDYSVGFSRSLRRHVVVGSCGLLTRSFDATVVT